LADLTSKILFIYFTFRNNLFNPNNEEDQKTITFLKENLQDFFDITTAVEKIKENLDLESLKKVEDRVEQEITVLSFNIIGLRLILSFVLEEIPVPGDRKPLSSFQYLSFFSKGITRFLYGTKIGKKQSITKYERLSTIDDEQKNQE